MYFASSSPYYAELNARVFEEAAEALASNGDYEEALPLMLESVRLRENSWALCVSLSALATLNMNMLRLSEVEKICLRMLKEARRYDTQHREQIAQSLLKEAAEEKQRGILYGMDVLVTSCDMWNTYTGKKGVIRGRTQDRRRYIVEVGNSKVSLLRENFRIEPLRLITISVQHECPGLVSIQATTLGGVKLTSLACKVECVDSKAVREHFAQHINCNASMVRMILPNGDVIEDGIRMSDLLAHVHNPVLQSLTGADGPAEHLEACHAARKTSALGRRKRKKSD